MNHDTLPHEPLDDAPVAPWMHEQRAALASQTSPERNARPRTARDVWRRIRRRRVARALVTALFLAYGLLGLVDAAFMPAVLWDSGSEATAFRTYEQWPAAWKLNFDQIALWPVGFLGVVAARRRGLLASVIVRASAWIICLGSVFAQITEFASVSLLPALVGLSFATVLVLDRWFNQDTEVISASAADFKPVAFWGVLIASITLVVGDIIAVWAMPVALSIRFTLTELAKPEFVLANTFWAKSSTWTSAMLAGGCTLLLGACVRGMLRLKTWAIVAAALASWVCAGVLIVTESMNPGGAVMIVSGVLQSLLLLPVFGAMIRGRVVETPKTDAALQWTLRAVLTAIVLYLGYTLSISLRVIP